MQSPQSMIKPGAVSGDLASATAPGRFIIGAARKLAAYAARAYAQANCSDAATNASALVSELVDDQCLVVAFKGSSEPKDFLQDAKFEMRPLLWTDGVMIAEVHAGFLEDFQAINVAVMGMVRSYLAANPAGRIFITGHSLGGALAILCAMEFQRQGLPIAGVYTFGQPRVGNHVFGFIYDEYLRNVTFRLVNGNDIVPRVPGILLGYHHCGHEIFLPEPGNGWREDPSLLQKALSDEIGLFMAFKSLDDVLISSHFIAAYQKRLSIIQPLSGANYES